jgi:hypothetical protein
MWWFEVVVVVAVVVVACLAIVIFEPGDCIWMEKITDKQEPAAARRGGLRTFTGWTDNAVYVRAAEQPSRRCNCVMVRRGPFSIVIHKGFPMVNVLRSMSRGMVAGLRAGV